MTKVELVWFELK